MSREFWRLALICLLLAALPLSGFAAASMIGCAPVHRSAGGVQEALHPAHTGGHVQDASHHAEAGGHAHHAGHGTAGPHGVADDTQQCSSCAPCCVGMALFYDAPLRLADAVPLADYPPAETRYRSAWLDQLDRPPRFFLA